jgi:gliding motility-associated-like protein
MKFLKINFFVLSLVFLGLFTYAQPNNAVLYINDFDITGANFYSLNAGPAAINYGDNKWIINDEFSGQGITTNTPSQLNTGGSIGVIGAPNGKYMHIHNGGNPVVKNCNFDPLQNSVRWAKLTDGICTYGYKAIELSFWWTCMGDSVNAFGEVYFSLDGGNTWVLTTNTDGKNRYHSNDLWRYTIVSQPEFVDQLDLRFAFKWKNSSASIQDTLPFGIDDIFVVGVSDTLFSPTLSAAFLLPDPVCQQYPGQLSFYFNLSDTLCIGDYSIEISDSACNWSNPTIIGYLNQAGPFFGGFYVAQGVLPIPTTIPKGTCYCWRINRIWPPPLIAGGSSGCFEIGDCQDSIKTLQPAVLKDPQMLDANGFQHICINSVIDCPFESYGAYNPPNIYNLELSDSNGVFTNPATIIGSLPSSITWDPALPPPPIKPGSVSGKIPEKDVNNMPLVPGCNYFIRVTATDPIVNNVPYTPQYSKPWGPFCIDECDIKSNETIDITCCLTNTSSSCHLDTIAVDMHQFDSILQYFNGNDFIFEIMDNKTMAVLYSGTALGHLIDTTSGKFLLNLPNLTYWLNLGLAPKMYYLRIIANNTNTGGFGNLGTLIRITINGISGNPLTITGPSDIICGSPTTTLTFTLSPNTATSKYIWSFAGLGSTAPIPGPSVTLPAGIFPTGTYSVTVVEYAAADCFGPSSAPFLFTVIGPPDVHINGDPNVCVGDTVTYSVNYEPATYYEWQYSGGQLIDSANNQITVHWTNIGNGNVSVYGLGFCGSSFNTIPITVLPKPVLTLRDTIICKGTLATLVPISSLSFTEFYWYIHDTTLIYHGDTLSLILDTSTVFQIMADYFGCNVHGQIKVTVVGDLEDQNYSSCNGKPIQLDLGQGSSFNWTPSIYLSSSSIANPLCTPTETITYNVVIGFNNALCPTVNAVVNVNVSSSGACDIGPNIILIKGDSTLLNACPGFVSYSWSPSKYLNDSTIANPIAKPDTTTTFIVYAKDAAGCLAIDTILVTVVLEPTIIFPNAFTPNGDGENDIFKPYAGGVEELLYFEVYNRWGEKMFVSNDINIGWDGKYKGVVQEMDTYVYKAKARVITNEELFFKGDFMLIR